MSHTSPRQRFAAHGKTPAVSDPLGGELVPRVGREGPASAATQQTLLLLLVQKTVIGGLVQKSLQLVRRHGQVAHVMYEVARCLPQLLPVVYGRLALPLRPRDYSLVNLRLVCPYQVVCLDQGQHALVAQSADGRLVLENSSSSSLGDLQAASIVRPRAPDVRPLERLADVAAPLAGLVAVQQVVDADVDKRGDNVHVGHPQHLPHVVVIQGQAGFPGRMSARTKTWLELIRLVLRYNKHF